MADTDTEHASSPRAVLLLAGPRNTEGMIIRIPDKATGRRLDRGGDLVGLVPDHNLERTINIFVLASSPYTYFGSAGHP